MPALSFAVTPKLKGAPAMVVAGTELSARDVAKPGVTSMLAEVTESAPEVAVRVRSPAVFRTGVKLAIPSENATVPRPVAAGSELVRVTFELVEVEMLPAGSRA